MHEVALTRRLLTQVRELVDAHGGGTVREVRIQIGPLSGVEAELLASAFETLRDEASMVDAVLVVDLVPLEARCRNCGRIFQPVRFCFHCPFCDGTDTEVVRGDGVILESVSFDEAARGATACIE